MDPFVYTIEDGRVGGRPGPMKIPWNLKAMAEDGWTVIVSFECELLEPEHVKEIRALGLEHRLMCVADFTAPAIEQLFEFNELVDREVRDGGRVLTHCYAGRGRTGTFLASRLVWRGARVEDAVDEVRDKIMKTQGTLVGAIEPGQMEALHHFARLLASRRQG